MCLTLIIFCHLRYWLLCFFFLIEFTSPFHSLFIIVCVYRPRKEVSMTGLLTTRICPWHNNSWHSAPRQLFYLPDLFDADCDLFPTVQSNRHSGAVSRGVKVQLKQSSTVEVWWAGSVSPLFKTLSTCWTVMWSPLKQTVNPFTQVFSFSSHVLHDFKYSQFLLFWFVGLKRFDLDAIATQLMLPIILFTDAEFQIRAWQISHITLILSSFVWCRLPPLLYSFLYSSLPLSLSLAKIWC